MHHHDPSSASGGPHLLSVAQLPHVKRAARFQRKLKRPRGALGRCEWGCGSIPAWHASSARSRRAVRAAIDHFAAVDQSGSAPHVRLLNTRYRGDFVALPSRWAPRHVAQEGPLYRVFKSRCTLGTGATSVAAGSSAVTPRFHSSWCWRGVMRGVITNGIVPGVCSCLFSANSGSVRVLVRFLIGANLARRSRKNPLHRYQPSALLPTAAARSSHATAL